MDKVELNTFPTSKLDAITMLYLQNQDLSGKTPSEIASMYDEAYAEFRAAFIEIRNQKHR